MGAPHGGCAYIDIPNASSFDQWTIGVITRSSDISSWGLSPRLLVARFSMRRIRLLLSSERVPSSRITPPCSRTMASIASREGLIFNLGRTPAELVGRGGRRIPAMIRPRIWQRNKHLGSFEVSVPSRDAPIDRAHRCSINEAKRNVFASRKGKFGGALILLLPRMGYRK